MKRPRLKLVVAAATVFFGFWLFPMPAASADPVVASHSADCDLVTVTLDGFPNGGGFVNFYSPSHVAQGGSGGPTLEFQNGVPVSASWADIGPDVTEGGTHTYAFLTAVPDWASEEFQFDASSCTEGGGETSTIPLHNDAAEEGTDCPDEVSDYWHFVLTPNDGSSAFVSITLNLGDEAVTFTGDDLIPNGTQEDNVFVAVPDGYELSDLMKEGSEAEVTGPATKFVLSHICTGGDGSTTTTTSTTSSTTTTSSSTSSTVGGTSQTTSRQGAVLGTDIRSLPRTGSNLGFAVSAAALVLSGGGLCLAAKRKLASAGH